MEKLLIANRGEIVVRIARTARRMGMDTVGVFAEPDSNALHVDSVDEAVALGGSTPAESYLRGDLIVDAARRTGADAIHPGYGFLAENADFAASVIAAGITWDGPTPEQISLLGDKVVAKEVAVAAGVPTAPVWPVAPESIPADITFPALVKAAAGGGGRGMRVVESAAELSDAIDSASREAESAFGDGTVFVEPYITHSRHIEVQIMGDSHGNVIHLGERDCSVQRRNQKVIEESPAPRLDSELRRILLDGAISLARHVGYQNAGTVEFLVGADGFVSFLEVNTRLQVEHPVTEMITGLDLVELQLRVADGEELPLEQSDVRLTGHAVEVRIVAEDPARGWLPSSGEITAFEFPLELRVDSGVRAESVISGDYDSLLAKAIAHGQSREQAIASLAKGLKSSVVGGVQTNVAATIAVLQEHDYASGSASISYLGDHPEVLQAGPDAPDRLRGFAAAVIVDQIRDRASDHQWGFVAAGWRNLRTQGQRSVWLDQSGSEWHAELITQRDGTLDLMVGSWPTPSDDGSMSPDGRIRLRLRLLGTDPAEGLTPRTVALEVDGLRTVHSVIVSGRSDTESSIVIGSPFGQTTWLAKPRFEDHESAAVGAGPVSPLPGTVIAVHVGIGDQVIEGEALMVVEAMKMEHQILAATAATVTEVRFSTGDKVEAGDLLISLEARIDDSGQE